MPINVAITGFTASGKSSVACLLVNKLGGANLNAVTYDSGLVKREVRAAGLPVNARSVRDYAYMRNRAEPSYWVAESIKAGRAIGAELIIVDGVRNLAGLRYLDNLEDPAVTIGVTAGYRTRLRRATSRSRDLEQGLTRSEITALLREEMVDNPESWGFQVAQCLAKADFLIPTGGCDLSLLLRRLEPALERLRYLLMVNSDVG
jgi:hypothetical protein